MPVTTAAVYQNGVDCKTDGQSVTIDTQAFTQVSISVYLNSLSGGATPGITFAVDKVELDGRFTQVAAGSAVTAASASPNTNITKLEVGPGLPVNIVLPKSIRIRWVVTGGPTTAVADIMVTGR